MKFNRVWARPNSKTFKIKPIKEFVEKYIDGASVIIDPFANDCKYGTITNDLNPEYDTDYHMDALDFRKKIKTESADVVLKVGKCSSNMQEHLRKQNQSIFYTKITIEYQKILSLRLLQF